MSKKNKTPSPAVEAPEIKLDLGAGRNPIPGFTSVDLYSEADVKCDLFQTPWKDAKGKLLWADNSVSEIYASHFVEHIPRVKRWPFFEECWRVLKDGGTMRIFVPSWKSERALGDMTHEFPPVVAFAFYYLNKDWREANKLTYGPYAIKCNFDNQAGPTAMSPTFATRSHEAQVFAATHYLESYQDMWVTLTKRPM
jgi:hypothetical protein